MLLYNICMIIKLTDLINLSDDKRYKVDISSYPFENNLFIRRLEDVKGEICFYYDASDKLKIEYSLNGKMICPDAITLQDVDVEFDLNEIEDVVSKENEDGFYFYDSMSLEKLVAYIVSPHAPIKVVKNKKIEYSRGDGWSFVSEEDYEKSKKDEIDPRLQKLLEYKIEEDD